MMSSSPPMMSSAYPGTGPGPSPLSSSPGCSASPRLKSPNHDGNRIKFLSFVVDRKKSQEAFSNVWTMANVAAAMALFIDSRNSLTSTSELVHLFEYTVVFVLLLNVSFNIFRHLFPMEDPIVMSRTQMELMNIDPDKKHAGFKLSPEPQTKQSKHPNPFTPLSGSFINSPHSSPLSTTMSPTMNASLNSSSWVFHSSPQSPSRGDPQKDMLNASTSSPQFNSSVGEIKDEDDLNDYLEEFEAWERQKASSSATAEQSSPQHSLSATGMGSSFWKPESPSSSFRDYSPVLKNLSYSLSTPMPGGSGSATGKDGEEKSKASRSAKESICYRVGIDPLELVSWMQNLRMWISQTVLVRLVKEIETTNKQLSKLGMNDILIGEAGLEKVKRCSQLAQVVHHIPHLHNLVPFLEITPHQDYLVNRIKELATGGAMSEFRWNGGGRFKGTDWNEKLPTDSEIVMHCVACYFDSRLPPAKGVVDGRTFSSLYFFKLPDKSDLSKIKVPCAIVQTSLKPPHYVLQIGESKMEVNPGRNNLFHTLLLFLHRIKTKQDGMLGRVNFGMSGINILWVID